MGKTYRIGTWKVPAEWQFDEKTDVRKSLAVLRVLAGTISHKDAMAQYPRLGIDVIRSEEVHRNGLPR